MKNLLLANAMLAGIVAPASAQFAATNQSGGDGMQTKTPIDSHHLLLGVSATRLLPTCSGRVIERGT
jgi:hypothetical protein